MLKSTEAISYTYDSSVADRHLVSLYRDKHAIPDVEICTVIVIGLTES